jgi:hypothetical protein
VRDERNEILIEAAVSAYRERDSRGRILPSPAWYDLAPDDRDRLYTQQLTSRILESTLDSHGRSGTVRAVLARIR